MQLESKFSIGDVVYVAHVEHGKVARPCPDCLGSRAWLAKLPNGEEIGISCPTCTHGYETTGKVADYEPSGSVKSMTIGSVRIETDPEPERRTRYMCYETGIGSGRIWYEDDLYASRAEAETQLPHLIEEARVHLAETRAWSRSKKRLKGPGAMAAYYRRQIRAAKKDIAAAERGLEREAAKPEEPESP